MLLNQTQVEWCGIRRPGSSVTLGVTHLDRGYFFESFAWMDKTAALEHYRKRIDKPAVPDESCILLEEARGFRLCIYQPGVEVVPYEQALKTICDTMRGSGKLGISDRRWGLRVFKKSFVGAEAVTWLADYLHLSRPEALALGQECLKRGLFSHVLGEQDFADDFFFYRFSEDGGSEGRLVSIS
ncbi:MAG: hypothetical protein NW237_04035 [Cyanobacteriota bacterium]|nr:hypothetical protein [Cyanobacteriota bacterium]